MTEMLGYDPQETAPVQPPLGVMDAVSMGWQLLRSDFWPVWIVGLALMGIQIGCSLPGMIPYIGGCFSLALGIFVTPALQCGLFYAIRQKIDGYPAEVNNLFEGFRQRYWQAVVAALPMLGISIACGIAIVGIVIAVMAGAGAFGGHQSDDKMTGALIVAGLIILPLILIMIVVMMLFIFAYLAVWDHPESGWAAVKDSVRVARAHLLSLVGLALLFAVIGIGAALVGIIALCVGIFFTGPVVTVWYISTLIYLYRSWTGQPLSQPYVAPDAGMIPDSQ